MISNGATSSRSWAGLSIHRDGFAERGGVAALRVFGRTYDVQTVTAGVQGQVALSDLLGLTTGAPLTARGLVGYRRAFGDVVPSALLAFTGGGQGFITSGVPVARDAIVASAGLDWQMTPAATLGIAYTGQAGRRAEDHGLKGSFSYRF